MSRRARRVAALSAGLLVAGMVGAPAASASTGSARRHAPVRHKKVAPVFNRGGALERTVDRRGQAMAAVAPTDVTSSQWAGAVRSGQTFSHVSATFVVPGIARDCGTHAGSAIWIGLGGFAPLAPFLQNGISIDGAGRVGVWWEAITSGGDQPSHPVPLVVHLGDVVGLDLQVLPGSQVLFTWSNLTTGKATSWLLTDASPFLESPQGSGTAEWIVEQPPAAVTMTGLAPVTWLTSQATTALGAPVAATDRTAGALLLHTAGIRGAVTDPLLPLARRLSVVSDGC